MNILDELRNRKILKDVTNEEKFKKLPKGAGVYIGFDPTAESLHLGNYIQIANLLRFKNAGYEAFAILGGATGMIGDPSGKSAERNLLDQETLLKNKKHIKAQLESFGLRVIDNLDFYKDVNVLEWLRDAGKLININYMINKDIVSSRFETGMSFTEFSYQLIQGWDFKNLYDKYGVRIQVGGSDQWGNITTGVEMIRKTVGDDNLAVGITSNLLLTASGKKFGKSEGNAIWLDRTMTSPYQLYQYVLNTPDEDLETIFNWVTMVPTDKVKAIILEHEADKSKRIAQKMLAAEIVKDIHSEEDARIAEKLSGVLFGKIQVSELTADEVLQLEGSIPTFVSLGGQISEVLIQIGACSSKREAREFIASGAIEVNGIKVPSEEFEVIPKAFDKKATIIRRGKKQFFLLMHK